MSKEGVGRVVTSMATSLPDRIMLFLDGVAPLHLMSGWSDLDAEDRRVFEETAQQVHNDFGHISFEDRHILDDAFSAFARQVQGYIKDRYRE